MAIVMHALLQAVPFVLVVGGLLALSYLATPAARLGRIQRAHAREMRTMREVLPAATRRVEYAGR